jgi:WD40 repeat protein
MRCSDYRRISADSPSIQGIIRNPFLLRLFIEAVPGIVAQGTPLDHVTRYSLYEAFIQQWFVREVGRKSPSEQEALGVSKGDPASVVSMFELLSVLLASEMVKSNVLSVSFESWESVVVTPFGPGDTWHPPHASLWRAVQAQARSWLEHDRNRLEFQYASWSTWEQEAFTRRHGLATGDPSAYSLFILKKRLRMFDHAVESFATTCPLRRVGSEVQFIHKSILEFLHARLLVLAAGSPDLLPVRAQRTAIALNMTAHRLLAEPEVLVFLADWRHTSYLGSTSSALRVRETLLHLVASSASASSASLDSVSSNAASVLNWMGEPMDHLQWQGVMLEGADLSRASLINTSLVGAGLSGSRLDNALLLGTDLREAELENVTFTNQVSMSLPSFYGAMAWHPVTPGLMIVGVAHTVEVWNVTLGQKVGPAFVGHQGWVECVAAAVVLETVVVASGSRDGSVRLWHDNGATLAVLHGHAIAIRALAFYGTWLSSGAEDGDVRVWSLQEHKEHCRPHPGSRSYVYAVAMFATITGDVIVAAGDRDGVIRLSDISTCLPWGPDLVGHDGAVRTVAAGGVQPSGGFLLASGGLDGTVRLWDAAQGTQIGLWQLWDGVSAVAFGRLSPTSPLLLASGALDGVVRVWDVASAVLVREPFAGHAAQVAAVCFGQLERGGPVTLVSGGLDSTMYVWSLESSRQKGEPVWGHSQMITWIAAARGDALRGVVATTSVDRSIRLWNVTAWSVEPVGRPLRGHSEWVTSAAFGELPGGVQVLATASGDGTIRVWQVPAGVSQGEPIVGHVGEVTCVTFVGPSHPGGGTLLLVSSGIDGTVRLWDAGTGRPVREPWSAHVGHARVVATPHTPSSFDIIASGGQDGAVVLWSAMTGTMVGQRMMGHSGTVWCLAFDFEGALLASAGSDSTIRLWNVSSQAAIGLPLIGHVSWVRSLAFASSTGIQNLHSLVLWSVGQDSRIRQWNVTSGRENVDAGSIMGFAGLGGLRSVVVPWDGMAVTGGDVGALVVWHTPSQSLRAVSRSNRQRLGAKGARVTTANAGHLRVLAGHGCMEDCQAMLHYPEVGHCNVLTTFSLLVGACIGGSTASQVPCWVCVLGAVPPWACGRSVVIRLCIRRAGPGV